MNLSHITYLGLLLCPVRLHRGFAYVSVLKPQSQVFVHMRGTLSLSLGRVCLHYSHSL